MISSLMKHLMGVLLVGWAVLVPTLAKASITGARASSDATNLYYEFTYSGTPNFFQTFLDADKNSATGYKAYGIGADFLLENGNLYKYAGSNGGWGWSRVKTVTMTNSNYVVRWTIAKTDIGSPSALNFVFQHDNPIATSAVMSQSISAAVSNSISLSVAGAPNLPYNGTSTLVTVGFSGVAPSKVTLARDGLAAFASWPGGTFFTLASDGKSISGNWCIKPSCWGYQSGAHYLTAVATYADGSSKSSTVSLNVVTSSPSPTPTPIPSPTPSPTPIATPTPTPTPTPVSSGATYYVSPNGSDSNPGTQTAPWKTMYSTVQRLKAGDTAIFADGIYYETTNVNWTSGGGTSSARITLKSLHKWGAVLMYPGPNHSPKIHVDVPYVTFDGFEITQAGTVVNDPQEYAIRGWMKSAYLEVRNVKAHHVWIGIKANGPHALVENCTIYDSAGGTDSVNADSPTIRGNDISLNVPGAAVGVLVKGGTRNAQIYNNYIHPSVSGTVGIFIGGATGYDSISVYQGSAPDGKKYESYNSVAWNNILVGSKSSGTNFNIGLGFMGAYRGAFFNNVVIGANYPIEAQNGPGTSAGWPYDTPTTYPTWENNIVVDGYSSGYYIGANSTVQGTVTLDYNLFFNTINVPAQAHGVSGDPLFISKYSDWRLQAGSPAINSGTVPSFPAYGGGFIDIARDFNGVVRSAPWDLGIYNVAP